MTKEAYIQTLESLENSPQDRLLTLSLMGALTLGGITLTETFSHGSIEHISSILSDSMVDDGWLDENNPFEDDISDIGGETALLVGSIGLLYLISKGIKSGSENEKKKKELIEEYKSKINLPESKNHNEDDYSKFISNLKTLISSGKITEDESNKYLRQVESGTISLPSILKITDRLIRRR